MNAAIRQRRRLFALLPLALLWMAASSPALSQDFDARHSQAVTANPPGVTFLLKLAGQKTQYHQGEIIPLQAVFTGSRPGTYLLNTDPGNRGLLWSSDSFSTDRPGGTVDPLAAYFDSMRGGGYSGPGPRWQPLDAAPVSVPLDLNEWLRFTRPGIYHVYMTCSRLTARTAKVQGLFFTGLPTTSAILQIEILPPDPAWSAKALAAALPAFNSSTRDWRYEAERDAAARTVRFLDTPEAAQAIISRYGTLTEWDSWNSPVYFESRLGLLGSPLRDLIIRQMQAKIADPNFPVGNFFLSDLAELQSLDTYPNPLPPFPKGDAVNQAAWQKAAEKRGTTWAAFLQENQARLQQALPGKLGVARARSLYTLFDPSVSDAATLARRRRVIVPLVASFGDLASDEQERLLGNDCWPAVRRPALLPSLRRLWAAAVRPEDMGFGFNDLILRHLYELSPQEGRRLILHEAAQPSPRVNMEVLGSLSEATLPELDQPLAANLERKTYPTDWDTNALLIARYATSAILPRVKAIYGDNSGKFACTYQSALLAYLLRVDSEFGVIQVKKALASRLHTGCYRSLLSDVSALYMCPQLQEIALAALHDPDPEVVTDAAKTLGAHGSPDVEASLWKQLRIGHEAGIALALATSPAWLINQTQLAEIQSLVSTSDAAGQSQIPSVNRGNSIYIYVDYISEDGKSDQWRLAQYAFSSRELLRRKMVQYPRGTVFTLVTMDYMASPQRRAAVVSNLQTFAKQQGMSVQIGK